MATTKSKAKTTTAQTPVTNMTLSESLIDRVYLPSEIYTRNGWIDIDVMEFTRRVLMEAMMDKLHWMLNGPKNAEIYAAKCRDDAARLAKRGIRFERDRDIIKGAALKAKNAQLRVEMMEALYDELYDSWVDQFASETLGEGYIPYESTSGNVSSHPGDYSQIDSELTDMLKAAGVSVDVEDQVREGQESTSQEVA